MKGLKLGECNFFEFGSERVVSIRSGMWCLQLGISKEVNIDTLTKEMYEISTVIMCTVRWSTWLFGIFHAASIIQFGSVRRLIPDILLANAVHSTSVKTFTSSHRTRANETMAAMTEQRNNSAMKAQCAYAFDAPIIQRFLNRLYRCVRDISGQFFGEIV